VRIAYGVAESGSDFALSDIFPHDILMDKNSGIDFRKGCYVGQEVVSRMQHRGTARRRVAIVASETELPHPGPDGAATAILAGEKPVGSLGTVVGKTGLAMVRTDRVAEALAQNTPLTAGGSPVSLALPGWTGLSFDAAPDA
ncbi:MAG: folate-binding protein, partial [Hoeflea sp.]|nr:folate-binding protein [Hoeflea sp.]